MKKQLLIMGLILLLITVGFSGCIEEKKEGQETSDTLSNLGYRCYGFGINPPGEVQTNQTASIWKTNWTMNESVYNLYRVSFTLQDEDSVTLTVSRSVGIIGKGKVGTWENGTFVPSKNKYEYEFNYALGNQSVSEYGADFMYRLAQHIFTNVTFISNTTTTINGMNAYVCVFIGEYGNQTKIKQVFVEKNGVVFELIYSASPSSYDKYLAVVDQSINSFTMQ